MTAPATRSIARSFTDAAGRVQFLEADLKTLLPQKLTFTHPDKIRELARRGEAWGDSESRQMLEHAIGKGRGGIYLTVVVLHGHQALSRRGNGPSDPRQSPGVLFPGNFCPGNFAETSVQT